MKMEYALADRIGDLRYERKMTQKALAEATGLNASNISRIESGESENLSIDTLMRFAEAFQVSADYLLGLTDIREPKQMEVTALGLSEKAAEKLMSGGLDTLYLNRLIEHPEFRKLLTLMGMFVSGQLAEGVGLTNQMMDSAIGMISELESMKGVETEKDQLLLAGNKADPETAGLEQISSCFRKMLGDMREEMRPAGGELTKEKFAQLWAECMKKKRTGRIVTEEDLLRIVAAKLFAPVKPDEEAFFHFYRLYQHMKERII